MLTNEQLVGLQAAVDVLKTAAKAEADADAELVLAQDNLAQAQQILAADLDASTKAIEATHVAEAELLAFVQTLT